MIVNKRSMAGGYAGLDNLPVYPSKIVVAFGDGKKALENIVQGLE